jgi:hypothetical protein
VVSEEKFFKIGQSETRIACGAMFVNGSGKFNNLYRGPSIDATKFQFIWENGFRGKHFLEINQSKTRMACGGHVC